ncbi:MAG: purine/pyrimidine permease [Oceanospirillaceae bacterium]|nr:purine/pyrimidine permease [Oceanospirillaceae bacterium]
MLEHKNNHDAPAPVDEVLPLRTLLAFGLQHVLVMAASPIASVFLMSTALGFDAAMTVNLLCATFIICGIGTILQSVGLKGFGARLPFIMLPGGAPIVLFILIAQQTDVATASGAVILTALFYFFVLPVFRRCLRFFPPVVVGTMLLLVAVNLVKISGFLVVGKAGSEHYADPMNLLLAFATIIATVLFSRLLKGTLGQLSIMLGLVAGALVAMAFGLFHFDNVYLFPLFTLPTLLPFGMPTFDLFAALPLMIFCVISMVEATGQTLAIGDAVDKKLTPEIDVPRTIRGDAAISLLGGLFGTSLIITSGENIGVVRATGIRSRYVTLVAGLLLILFALAAPLARLIHGVPEAVVGGTGLVVFAIVGTMGIDMLRRVDLRNHANMYIVAVALAVGLLPILVPGVYSQFPSGISSLLGNGVAMGAVSAAILNALFHHVGQKKSEAAVSEPAVREAEQPS